MEIRFLDVAQQELDEAVEYYNAESLGLGDHFLLEALAAARKNSTIPKCVAPLDRKQPTLSDAKPGAGAPRSAMYLMYESPK
jgi:hypothetical protein